MTKNRKDRERRRRIRRERQKAKLKGGQPRVHRTFKAKARAGDAAQVSLEFSGRPVVIDPKHPEDLGVRDAWEQAGHPTKGSA